MVLAREDFADLSLSELLNNIWLDAEFVIRGNCKSFFDDYIDFCIEFAERKWDESFQNFNFVIQMLLHCKKFGFSNICNDNIDSIIDIVKK